MIGMHCESGALAVVLGARLLRLTRIVKSKLRRRTWTSSLVTMTFTTCNVVIEVGQAPHVRMGPQSICTKFDREYLPTPPALHFAAARAI